ncbi:MAG: type 4a pilus biogenesis protein PilO [Vulcanimicrobiota bacterium]
MSLTSTYKVLLVVGFLMLDFVGFYLTEYRDKWGELSELEERLEHRHLVLEQKRAKEYALADSADEIAKLEAHLSNLLTQHPEAEALGLYIDGLEQIVLSSYENEGLPLAIESVTPLPASPPEGYRTQDFQMNFLGRYDAIEDFLYQMNGLQSEQLVAISSLHLSSTDEGPLRITMPMRAYLGEEEQP